MIDVISEQEFLSLLRSEYRQDELDDIADEREREILKRPEFRRLPRFLPKRRTRYNVNASAIPNAVQISAGYLAGALGPLVMALREGLTVRGWYNASVSTSITIATGVSQWSDLHSSGNNFTQATGADQPTYNTGISAIKSRSSVLGDGTSDFMTCTTYACPAPGTTPVYMWFIYRSVVWTAGRVVVSSTSATQSNCLLVHNAVSPAMRGNNGTLLENAGPTVGTWNRCEMQFQNTTSDYVKIAATNATGTAMGNNSQGLGAGGDRTFFSRGGGGASFCQAEVTCLLQTEGTANNRFRTFADYWITNYFGAGVGV